MSLNEKTIKEVKDKIFYASLLMPINVRQAILDFKVEVSTKVATAAASIGGEPTLYVNPEFVQKHANTDEKLMMLLMHECYHVLLGHTKLFSDHATRLDNIVFDAIINSRLCNLYKDEEYTSFFTDFYSDDKLPYCLLRPIGKRTPESALEVMNLLYNDNENVTYEDVYNLIKKLVDENQIDKSQLIGSHIIIKREDDDNPIYTNAREAILKKLQEGLPEIKSTRGDGGHLEEESTMLEDTSKVMRKKFKVLLEKSGVVVGKRFSPDYNSVPVDFSSFVYQGKDRRSAGKMAISEDIFYSYNHQISRRKKDENQLMSYVYLDVSGSVSSEVGKLMKLLINPIREGRCKTFLFSTEVAPITIKELKEGRYMSTGGTNINCVMEHFLNQNKIKRKSMILLTDGCVGRINENYLNELKNNKNKIYVGYFGFADDYWLKDITSYSVKLD